MKRKKVKRLKVRISLMFSVIEWEWNRVVF